MELRLCLVRVKIGYTNGIMILFCTNVGRTQMVFVKVKICLIPKRSVYIIVLVVKVKFTCFTCVHGHLTFKFLVDHNNTYFVSGYVDHQFYEFGSSTLAPIAPDDRGAELTFAETGYYTVFMMAKNNAFIQLDGNRIPTFQLR